MPSMALIGAGSDGISGQATASFWNNIFHANQQEPGNNFVEPIHFNNAGASPSPPIVLKTVAAHMAHEAMLGGYLAASRAQPRLDKVYASAARLVNARCNGEIAREEIALVESATVAWTRIFYSMAETLARQSENLAATQDGVLDRVILMSEAEYAANVVAAVKFAREQNDRIRVTGVRWRVLSIPSTTYTDEYGDVKSSGLVNLKVLNDMLAGRWKEGDGMLNRNSIVMVCITHIPTNSGIINPVCSIGDIINEHNEHHAKKKSTLPKCFYLVDACQSAGHVNVDVQQMKCHALAATGRKYLRGPRGTGFLYVREDVANALEPSHIDHSSTPVKIMDEGDRAARTAKSPPFSTSIDLTAQLNYEHKQGAARFEFWESNIAGKLGLGASLDYAVDQVGVDVIQTKCCSLGDKLRFQLRQIKGIRVYHDSIYNISSKQCGIVVFSVEGRDPSKIKEDLLQLVDANDRSFEVSIVPATSTPADSANTSTPDLIRASLSYFNTEEEIQMFSRKLRTMLIR